MPQYKVDPGQGLQRQLMVKTWGRVAIAAVLLAGVIGVLLLNKDSEPPKDIEPKGVKVVVLNEKRVVTDRLKSGTRFFVRYDAIDPADTERLRLGAGLGLRRDGKVINVLVTKLVRETDVRPPHGPVESIALGGPGPYEFRLPKLRSGWYQLCGGIRVGTPPVPYVREGESFCKTITVIDR